MNRNYFLIELTCKDIGHVKNDQLIEPSLDKQSHMCIDATRLRRSKAIQDMISLTGSFQNTGSTMYKTMKD